MKKQILTIAAVAAAATCAFSMAACSNGQPVKVLKDLELTSEEYAYAAPKESEKAGSEALVTSVNGYLAEWKADGTLDNLIQSYFDGDATFAYTNKTATAQAGDLVVATSPDFPPFENKVNGEYVGVDIEVAYKIAQQLNKTLFIAEYDFDGVIATVETGGCDLAMAGITATDKRKETMNFTSGYYTSAQVLTVLDSDPTFDGCTTTEEVEAILQAKAASYKIGTQAGTTGFYYADDLTATAVAYDSGALAMKDLSNGKIDAVILDKQPSIMIAASINK